MIDARRWVLVETWLSLGLRIEWCPAYDRDRIPQTAWQTDDDTGGLFIYAGFGVWQADRSARSSFARPPLTAPQLSTDVLRHELAHWLTATEDERRKRNFGAGDDGVDLRDTEARAIAAEPVIDALLSASARIANLALGGRS